MMSILIVDDEFDSRRALEILLELQGYEVSSAAGGSEALAMLREKEFDVILTDWMMPVMSGGELISRIRAEKLAEGHSDHRPHCSVGGGALCAAAVCARHRQAARDPRSA
jgi:CheY-like chemotaxis protein